MNNLTIGNVAIATVIIGVLDLIIVILVRTETILKAIERIKGIIKLDYKSRAKRSDDEIRIFKKHELVARERVRHSFLVGWEWNCKWTWTWSENLEPINIKGYCTGDSTYLPPTNQFGWLVFCLTHFTTINSKFRDNPRNQWLNP
jgi:hypothetical protein